ncbi:MAG TPA: DUF488 family protein [Gracilimonas sp.]|uniref:DUF488 domain-containing protein n=1 Tax=Gracilimonas sp. TaxID=1974203 RepID=UPI002D9057AA|nr:DUF488 family protein [Gracilimonas sp.]
MLKTKRVYEEPSKDDGYRILTERLWPRGVSKERAALDKWMKSIAPSHDLRKWFGHDADKWEEFKERYRRELFGSDAVNEMLEIIKNHETVTMVYASKDEEYNSTVLLKGFLEDLLDK